MFYRGGSLTWSIKSQNLQNLTILQKFSKTFNLQKFQ